MVVVRGEVPGNQNCERVVCLSLSNIHRKDRAMIALRLRTPTSFVAALLIMQIQPAIALQRDPAPGNTRLVGTTADLSLEVRNCREFIGEAHRIAETRGGSVSSSEIAIGGNRPPSGKFVLRVPAGALEEALADLRLRARRIEKEVIARNDITELLSQLAARIGSRQIVEQRYAQVLHATKQATEIMNVEKILTVVREEIDQMVAEQKVLSDRAKFSTITVTIRNPCRPCRGRGGTMSWAPQGF
jgi:hypothetical protein